MFDRISLYGPLLNRLGQKRGRYGPEIASRILVSNALRVLSRGEIDERQLNSLLQGGFVLTGACEASEHACRQRDEDRLPPLPTVRIIAKGRQQSTRIVVGRICIGEARTIAMHDLKAPQELTSAVHP